MRGRPLALRPEAGALGGVAPRAVGTPAAESLTGYLQRVAAAHVVPSAVVFDRLILSAAQAEGLWPKLTRLPQLTHDFDDFSSFDSRNALISLSPIFVIPL